LPDQWLFVLRHSGETEFVEALKGEKEFSRGHIKVTQITFCCVFVELCEAAEGLEAKKCPATQ
jgi:hypothetical protein